MQTLTNRGKRLRSNFYFERAACSTSRCVVITDKTQPDNPIAFVNAAFTKLTGYERDDVIGRNCRFLQGPETDLAVVAQIRDAIEIGDPIQCEILNYRKNGEPFWADLAIDPIHDGRGQIIGFVSAQFDISSKKAAIKARRDSEKQLGVIASNLPGYIYQRVLKPDGTIELPYTSASLLNILELPAGTVLTPDHFYACVHPDDRDRLASAVRSSATELSIFQSEFRLVSPSGNVHWYRSDAIPRAVPGGDIVWEGIAIEITKEKTGQIKLDFMESHDPLTGLRNRQVFHEAVRTAVSVTASKASTTVFYVDLDEFDAFNVQYGHAFGDGVLRRVGLRLTECAERWGGFVARLAGDEFAVLFTALRPDVSAAKLAGIIQKALMRPMTIDGQEVTVDVCIGIASYHRTDTSFPADAGDRGTELMMRANLALSSAKREGPGVCRAYTPDVDDRLRNRAQLRQSLQRAIAEQQFVLHYQPVVNLISGEVIGVEALVRWHHPELGLQRPDLFIPLAESTGLIVPLGAWVMREAMRQSQFWWAQGIQIPHIALNVSSIQLKKPGFIEMIEQALLDTGADANCFEIELTESILIDVSADILSQLTRLRSLGFSIAIDDFGTGHSNFKYLQKLPVDKIKIDQNFVRHLVVGSSDAAIIHAIIEVSQSLKLGTVAEGIETAMQRDFLIAEGCTTGQGYLFSLPLAPDELGRLLMRRQRLPAA